MELNKIYNGNCLEVLKTFEDNSIDSWNANPYVWVITFKVVDASFA